MFDVTALGEILIDFTPAGKSEQGNVCFERNPGGAPANVLACITRLGGKAAFIGKVGNDLFGNYLASVLREYNIDASGLCFSDTANTTLAFVQLDENGDRSFSFYRNPGADTTLQSDEVNYDLIRNSKVFHFGSLSLTHEPAKSATIAALDFARDKGCMISYDPNLRLPLWKSEEQAREAIVSVMGYANILKISEEELEFITGEADLEKGSKIIYEQYGTDVILVTRGAKGCYYRVGGLIGEKATFNSIKPVDTTGAGDAFLGAFLYSMLDKGINSTKDFDKTTLQYCITFANATASLCTSKRGAIPAMPDLQAVLKLMESAKSN